MPPGPVTGRFWARKGNLRAILHELNPRGGCTAGLEGQRINTPASTAKIRPGQAILIFFNSRRQSVRKASAVRLSSYLAGSTPNWRYTCRQESRNGRFNVKVR